jgi:uncharacterized protein YdaT
MWVYVFLGAVMPNLILQSLKIKERKSNMPFTKNDYPNSIKNLEEAKRNKAIEIANRLLEENYEEGRAISIAISQAKEWYENRGGEVSSGVTHHLLPQDDGWVLKSLKDEKPFEFETKEEAMDKIKSMSKENKMKVMIHDSDGKFQKLF